MTERSLVQHFSDVLCVWAYVGNARLEHIAGRHGDKVTLELRYCSVFPDARNKIAVAWKENGGAQSYGAHVRAVANRFGHVTVHPDVWSVVQPRSSTPAHQFLKAVEIEQGANADPDGPVMQGLGHRLAWALRRAFFQDARDISDWRVLCEIADSLALEPARIEAHLRSGEAAARLDADQQLAQKLHVIGSPTFVMNEGRQILYGNVGAHLIGANIEELLRAPAGDEASWC